MTIESPNTTPDAKELAFSSIQKELASNDITLNEEQANKLRTLSETDIGKIHLEIKRLAAQMEDISKWEIIVYQRILEGNPIV